MVGFPEASPRNRLRDVRRLVLLFAALLLGTLPADTGATAEGDAAKGKAIYASAGCGGCHTFSAAGSTGTVGPNLDDSSIDFAGAVEQIKNGGGGMPPFGDRLSDQEIADVAAFVTQ
jgi:mono/diheme cytochrome c family protein